VFNTRTAVGGAFLLEELFGAARRKQSTEAGDPEQTVAALPYSSGTTGLPKGVMLSHSNLVANVFQFLAPGEEATYTQDDTALCCLPLYHIYGLNVVLNAILAVGGTLVVASRFDEAKFLRLLRDERPTFLPLVPPLVNCLCHAAEQDLFPREHCVRYVKSGAAPMAPELARRFTDLTGIRLRQGYGMTEASPVTHIGFIEADRYRPDSIGQAVARTECRLEGGQDSCCGELVMQGPQFMLGYWKSPDATASVLRDGWYWSGDVATVDTNGFLRDGHAGNTQIAEELCGYVGERLTAYKQPREVRFVHSIPRNPSGKILRRKLRDEL